MQKIGGRKWRKIYHEVRVYALSRKLPLNRSWEFYADEMEKELGMVRALEGSPLSSGRHRCLACLQKLRRV